MAVYSLPLVFLFWTLSVCLSVCLSVWFSACLLGGRVQVTSIVFMLDPICLSVWLPVYLSACLPVRLSGGHLELLSVCWILSVQFVVV